MKTLEDNENRFVQNLPTCIQIYLQTFWYFVFFYALQRVKTNQDTFVINIHSNPASLQSKAYQWIDPSTS